MTFKYDVAISFLAADNDFAKGLADRLGEDLEVFYFPRNQEDLAGTDGMESMRTVFHDEARLNVVLFRDNWGHTRWTRVEETAIKDRAFNKGWDSLFFVTLQGSTKPEYVPEQKVRFHYPEYNFEQMVGAIRKRVKDLDGKFQPMTPQKLHEINKRKEDLIKRRHHFRNSHDGLQLALKEMKVVFEEIKRLAGELPDLKLEIGSNEERCVLCDGEVSMHVGWKRDQWVNLSGDAALVSTGWDAEMEVSGRPRYHHLSAPAKPSETKYKPDLADDGTICWRPNNRDVQLSSIDVANECVMQFVDLRLWKVRQRHKPRR